MLNHNITNKMIPKLKQTHSKKPWLRRQNMTAHTLRCWDLREKIHENKEDYALISKFPVHVSMSTIFLSIYY